MLAHNTKPGHSQPPILNLTSLITTRELGVRRFGNLSWQGRALAVVVVIGGLLRFYRLGSQSYWADEWTTVMWTHLGLRALIVAISREESTPPLYYLAASAWTKVFGVGAMGLRSLSALAGTATIPVVYCAGRTLVSRSAGLVAALLVGTSPFLIWYSQEARSYALFTLLTSLALLMFARALRQPSVKALVGWAAFSELALATHYFAAFVIVPEAVWLFVGLPALRRAIAIVSAQVVAFGAALAPLAIIQQSTGNAKWIAHLPLSQRLAQIPRQFAIGVTNPPVWLVSALAFLTVIYLVMAAVQSIKREVLKQALPWACICVAVVLVSVVLAATGIDFVLTRNLIPASILLALTAGAIVGAQHRYAPVLTASLVAAGLASAFVISDTRVADQRADWRAAARAMGHSSDPRLIVLPTGSWDGVAVPITLYLAGSRGMPASASVTEIDVLGRTVPSLYARDASSDYELSLLACWWGAPCSVRSAPLPASPPNPSFRLIDVRRVGEFTVLRYRSRSPVLLTDRAMADFALMNRLSDIVLEQNATPSGP